MLVKRWLIQARWCVRMLRWRGGGVFPYRGIVFLCLECVVCILILKFARIWRFEGKLSLTFDVLFKCQQHFNLFCTHPYTFESIPFFSRNQLWLKLYERTAAPLMFVTMTSHSPITHNASFSSTHFSSLKKFNFCPNRAEAETWVGRDRHRTKIIHGEAWKGGSQGLA